MGLRTLALPEDLGGVGADALTCCIVTEELAVGDTDVAAVLAETSALGAAAVRGDDAGAARPLPARRSSRTTTIHLALAEPRAGRRQRARRQLPPPGHRRCASRHHRDPRSGDDWIINGTKDCVANAPVAKLIAVEAQTDKGPALFLVPRDTPGLSVTAQPEPALVSRLLRPDRAEGLPGAGRTICSASAAPPDPGRAAPSRAGAQPRHRPRRLRGRAGLRGASRAGRPPHRRAPGDRHQARRHRDPARHRAQRDLARRLGRRSSGRLRRPQPARPAARRPSPRSSPPRRSIARPRTPPNASAPWA